MPPDLPVSLSPRLCSTCQLSIIHLPISVCLLCIIHPSSINHLICYAPVSLYHRLICYASVSGISLLSIRAIIIYLLSSYHLALVPFL